MIRWAVRLTRTRWLAKITRQGEENTDMGPLLQSDTDVTIYQGDTETWTITVTDATSGDPVNLTGAAVELRVRSPQGYDEPALQLFVGSGITLTQPALGEMTVNLTASQTAALECRLHYYWIRVTLDGATRVLIPPSELNVRKI